MARTLKDLKKRVETLIQREGEDAPVAFSMFLKGDLEELPACKGMNDDQLTRVLEQAMSRFDAEQGLNWDVLGTIASELED